MQYSNFGTGYAVSEEESNRINILKFIAICFVIYIHSYTGEVRLAGETVSFQLPLYIQAIEYYISQVLARYAVPFFFFISAILLFRKQRNWCDVLKNKVRTLLVPYLLWNTFWILAFVCLESFSITKGFFPGDHTPILEYDLRGWLALYGLGKGYPHDYPLWFLRDLMVVILFSPLIWKIADRFTKPAFAVTLLWIIFDPFNLPFKAAVQYFFLGACVVKLGIRLSSFDKYPMSLVTAVYLVMSVITLVFHAPALRSLFFLISFVFWIRLSKIIVSHKHLGGMLLKLSASTFFVYAAHELTLSSFRKVCVKVFAPTAVSALLQYIFLPVFIISVCVIGDRIVHKLCPKLHRVITGSR